MLKNILLFHFGDCGIFDENNPLKLFQETNISELLYLISSSEPFTLDSKKLSLESNIDIVKMEELLKKLEDLELIENKEGCFKVCFPVFLNKDLGIIKSFSTHIAQKIAMEIIERKNNILKLVAKMNIAEYFPSERILYHIIGDCVFDGKALDYFADKGLFSISKPQKGNRNYILVGYEDSRELKEFSDKLLCSSNNKYFKEYRFNSFGDSNGNRKDLYRFFRQIESSVINSTKHEKLNQAYNSINHSQNLQLLEKIGQVIKNLIVGNKVDKTEIVNFMTELNYLNNDSILQIPVFTGNDNRLMNEIIDLTISIIEKPIIEHFNSVEFDFSYLSAIKHNIDFKEIANELWHLVFGEINENLIKHNFFSTVHNIDGEGRYLQAVYIGK